jgi:uncharacterized protein YndB with AHSA1/START domain
MIRKSVLLACSPEKAFALFTEQASLWWPESRRHTNDAASTIQFTPEGRFFERSSDGREVELGRVRVWDRPHRLVMDFYPGTHPEQPTEVSILLTEEGDGTRLTLEHRATAASAGIWKARAPAFARSWDVLLPSLAALAGRSMA